ncbi:sensor domain-containing protein [Mycobacterium saskatchewanense]|uniref:sensor domain-containing protein n=1 Tax=Mycobacterium saskatchewanense TaxID=220927 RepID=UPI0013026144|nr:sensor domain-containing protein [Mycobacterium saskatchewanense]
MKKRWSLTVLPAVAMIAAGCTATVGGEAQPVPTPILRPLAGPALKRALLGRVPLSRVLKQSLVLDPRFPPRFGGPEVLRAAGPATSVDCLGVAGMLEQIAYQSSNVHGVAVEGWRHATKSASVTAVKEGIVSLPTAAEANTLFAEFSRQWQACEGKTQPLSDSVFRLKAKITQVRTAGSVLGATVWVAFESENSDSDSIPAERAVGVRGNCLVEVEVDLFNAVQSTPLSGDSDAGANSGAIEVAQRLMDNLDALR